MIELSTLLNFAISVALSVADTLEKDREMHQNVEQDLPRDVKVGADREFESIIVDRLLRETPYSVLSEESGYFGREKTNAGYRWIIDPLDGSLNFSRGIPINCISIALWKGMEPRLGVVYDFNRKELFSGVVGKGAWLNGKAIKVSEVCEKSKAVLCTGFPVATDFSRASLLDLIEQIRLYKKIRLFGSAALSLAYVSCGRADVYIENDIKIWDVAAGIAIVKAAEGTVKYENTGIENIYRVRASNQYLE